MVGVEDGLKGHLPFAFYVLKDNALNAATVRRELIEMVRKDIGAVAAFKIAVAVPDLPRTRSGKIPRKSIADLASGKPVKVTLGCLSSTLGFLSSTLGLQNSLF